METVRRTAIERKDLQFGLMGLMEFVTISAILMALSGATGVAASVCLLMSALALAVRCGPAVLVMFASALVAADSTAATISHGLLRQIAVILIAALLCRWFCCRGSWQNR